MIVSKKVGKRVLLVHDMCEKKTLDKALLAKLSDCLAQKDIEVITVTSSFDAQMMIVADPMIQAVLLDWDLADDKEHTAAKEVVDKIHAQSEKLPIFLFADRENVADIPVDVLKITSDFIWLYEDTADFIAGRIEVSVNTYLKNILPPMFRALAKFSEEHEYSWHTPAHTGGTAFIKAPSGRAFFDFYGENLFRTDLSISVGELGSLLDHSGPIGEGEKYAAKVFGAHRSYTVTNGSSTSNRVIFMACVKEDQVALCDRNCHKSIEQAMTLSGAVPNYMMPRRNFYGIIGPIPPQAMEAKAIEASIKANPLIKGDISPVPVHAIVTNSTYDGVCYNARHVESLLEKSVDRMHFDEAWYGYARFNPIYKDRFAMFGEPSEHQSTDMTIFATQSTHKLLAALSQASFIHIREGKKNISHARFNESFMMHASTSPCYPIIASNDIAAAMMEEQGKPLTDGSIREAVAFRQLIAKLNADFTSNGEWFFDCWQPDYVTDANGKKVPFRLADPEYLATNPDCWVCHTSEEWHGFGDIEDGWAMLDPIKVSITTPGISPAGLAETGIPASILTAYLTDKEIIPEKTQDFTVLMLFSMGVTKGKWGTLVEALLKFKEDYDANTSLETVLPDIYSGAPDRYKGMGLRDLCHEMFATMKKYKTTECMQKGFEKLPHPEMSPLRAYQQLVLNNIERVTLDKAAGRTLATGIVPYPPGIPLIMPGENAGDADGPALSYLKALEAFDKEFPGFGHDSHGVEVENGKYHMLVLKK